MRCICQRVCETCSGRQNSTTKYVPVSKPSGDTSPVRNSSLANDTLNVRVVTATTPCNALFSATELFRTEFSRRNVKRHRPNLVQIAGGRAAIRGRMAHARNRETITARFPTTSAYCNRADVPPLPYLEIGRAYAISHLRPEVGFHRFADDAGDFVQQPRHSIRSSPTYGLQRNRPDQPRQQRHQTRSDVGTTV
jgi:hypothetical protein